MHTWIIKESITLLLKVIFVIEKYHSNKHLLERRGTYLTSIFLKKLLLYLTRLWFAFATSEYCIPLDVSLSEMKNYRNSKQSAFKNLKNKWFVLYHKWQEKNCSFTISLFRTLILQPKVKCHYSVEDSSIIAISL